ncbi:ArnT family glycosyltransferase [Zavarzinella formosa]|uniref:ArnT family glycosyltransferase n=1 Tax=Zavarzinella formosa TaxID=360055 RepID=UPI000304B0D3|nr:glycosyltransferase family 39 protein [Zavarzinella formosa]
MNNLIELEAQDAEAGTQQHQDRNRGGFGSPRSRAVLLPCFFLLVLCLLLFANGLMSRSLWASHEARAAQNAQTMLDTGDWLLPRLFDGTAELQKPAGFYWLVAVVGGGRGHVDEIAVRFPAIFAGAFTVMAVWWWLRQQGRPVAGLVAGACLASAVHFTGTARIGRIDIPLTAAVTGMLLTLHQPVGKRRWVQILVPALFGTFALLLKGPIGLVLVSGVWLLHCFAQSGEAESAPPRRFQDRMKQVFSPNHLITLSPCFLAILFAAPWFIAVHRATDGEFSRVFFWYHHINRAFGGAEALGSHPWWFYLPRLALDFLPWTPLALVALWKLPRRDAAARFGLDWLVVMVIVLSASRFKRADYLLPAYPGLAIVVGCWAEGWYASRTLNGQRLWRTAFFGMLVLMPVGWFGFDHYVTAKEQASRETEPFARQVRELSPAPAPVVMFRVENHLLAYQLGRPVRTLTGWGDLLAEWRHDPVLVVVVREDEAATLREHLPFPTETVADSRAGSPAGSYRPMVLIRRTP